MDEDDADVDAVLEVACMDEEEEEEEGAVGGGLRFFFNAFFPLLSLFAPRIFEGET